MVSARPLSRQRGFALLFVLIMVFILAVGITGAALVWSMEVKEEKETQLLFVGDQYRQAIRDYFFATPGHPAYPQHLEDLLKDPRFPQPVRHLRQLYPDPITGMSMLTMRDTESQGIIGVYSPAKGQPLKIKGFQPENEAFTDAASYSQWQFVFEPMK